MQYYVGEKCLKIEVWSSFLKGNIDWKVLTSFSVCMGMILGITWCQSFSPLSEAPAPAGCGPRNGAALGQGWAPTATVAILSPRRVWSGTLCLRGIQMLNSNPAVDCSGTAMVHRCFSLLSTLLNISFLPQPELGTLMNLLVPAQQT